MINAKANPLLAKTEQAVRAKVPPDQMKAFEKIIAAGVKVMYSEGMHKLILQQFQSNDNPAEAAGEGAAKLMGILINQSKGTMPMEAGMPASDVILLEILDMLDELGKLKVDKNTLAEAAQSKASALMQLFGITPQKLDQMMAQAQQKKQPEQAQPAPQQTPQPQQQPRGLIGAPA